MISRLLLLLGNVTLWAGYAFAGLCVALPERWRSYPVEFSVELFSSIADFPWPAPLPLRAFSFGNREAACELKQC
jgi:hypothetical protein